MEEPSLITFLINIGGAAALLIWAVRLVRKSVERGFANQLRSWLRHSASNRIYAAGTGMFAAVFLQSSTAVALLVSNFVATGGLSSVAGLSILLGADLGSAIVTQLLLFRLPILIPLFLLSGVVISARAKADATSQVGTTLIGLALIFVSLDLIRAATAPLLGHAGTLAVVEYLGQDLLTAFLLGAVVAWVIHSSVAAVLMFVMLAAQSIVPITTTALLVLGANLGGAFIAYVLTLSTPVASRRMVITNLILRGGGAVGVAVLIALKPQVMDWLGANPAQQAINLHLAYNVALAVLFLPFAGLFIAICTRFTKEADAQSPLLGGKSSLDRSVLDRPKRALDCTARELLGMGQKIEQMLLTLETLFDDWNAERAKAIIKQDEIVKEAHLDVKLYLSSLGEGKLKEEHSRRSMDLATISNSLDAASDSIARTLLPLAEQYNAQGLQFSEKGRKEISGFAMRVFKNVQLSLNVMMNQSPDDAKKLVKAKEKVARIERKLQRNHLSRLGAGQIESIETSNIHQEILRALKRVNSCFSVVGYSILDKSGDLLKSRLS